MASRGWMVRSLAWRLSHLGFDPSYGKLMSGYTDEFWSNETDLSVDDYISSRADVTEFLGSLAIRPYRPSFQPGLSGGISCSHRVLVSICRSSKEHIVFELVLNSQAVAGMENQQISMKKKYAFIFAEKIRFTICNFCIRIFTFIDNSMLSSPL